MDFLPSEEAVDSNKIFAYNETPCGYNQCYYYKDKQKEPEYLLLFMLGLEKNCKRHVLIIKRFVSYNNLTHFSNFGLNCVNENFRKEYQWIELIC